MSDLPEILLPHFKGSEEIEKNFQMALGTIQKIIQQSAEIIVRDLLDTIINSAAQARRTESILSGLPTAPPAPIQEV